jgi:hypothetical protein
MDGHLFRKFRKKQASIHRNVCKKIEVVPEADEKWRCPPCDYEGEAVSEDLIRRVRKPHRKLGIRM